MKLIFGLGNPGREYENTRHNVGFSLLDKIAESNQFCFCNSKFGASYLEYIIDGEKVMLIKPYKFINLSGEVVKKFVDYYKVDLTDILVIHDDMDMPLGRVKFVYDSSSGGHNGIKNIESFLNSKQYLRLKIGIGNRGDALGCDFVLGKFNQNEKEILNMTYDKLLNVVDDFVTLSMTELMNKYNHK